MPPPPPPLPSPPPPGENPAIAPGPAQPLGNLRPPLQRNAPGSRKCVTEGEATGPSKPKSSPFANLHVHACKPFSWPRKKGRKKKETQGPVSPD
uniref:WAS/WASL-interacting protein family member 3-like n=1 Tax=Macaca mulatta TaxID=9544 RepID=UPI0010A26E29|nr:WAS/WASL-interacting protein family member 3-like [Macaca mulatta]XP_045244883.1 WAS/WASL-interacting protein family member 3-like [Macaca fascicularis]